MTTSEPKAREDVSNTGHSHLYNIFGWSYRGSFALAPIEERRRKRDIYVALTCTCARNCDKYISYIVLIDCLHTCYSEGRCAWFPR